ncbi:hypothetical protein CBER1_09637 [Cercospora berteroae]|uniref:Ricin B lectin domain-containing protein n=1 Tax=Cercospora berteroae TaxID=357750 RepID=A0A2S6BX20_9PEZI|nr:hypothetical protein CBER1_09637 [Cercospora berteroae]
MSDWIGPNTYYIVSRIKDTVFLDLAGGSPANDTKVQIWDGPGRDNGNSIWSIVDLGIGDSGKYEYHIINRTSGTHLSTPQHDLVKKGEGELLVKTNLVSPWNNRARWCIVPCRNNTGAYWIVPVLNTKLALNIQGGGIKNATPMILYPIDVQPGSENAQFYLRLSDDAILNCPNIPRAPLQT